MTKVMLVEDDDNLREIYGARLIAEGYEIISARDGEEALALAIKEKPDLLISDVMMPKISGFDMLDILRSSAETKNIRVIMMTALSQTEDKDRADKLGADRYLVKSQVTLEDVVKVTKEVLGETQPESHDTEPVAPLGGVDLSALTATTPSDSNVAASAQPAVTTPAPAQPAVTPQTAVAPAQDPLQTPAPTAPEAATALTPTPTPTTPAPEPPVDPALAPEITPAPAPEPANDDAPATGAPLNTNPDTFDIDEDELQAPEIQASAVTTPAPAQPAVTPQTAVAPAQDPLQTPAPTAPEAATALTPTPTPTTPAPEPPVDPALAPETTPAPAPELNTSTDPVLAEAQKLIENAQSTDSELSSVQDQIQDFIANGNPEPTTNPDQDTAETLAVPTPDGTAPAQTTTPETPHVDPNHKEKKIIQPLNDIDHSGPDLNALLAQEEAKEGGTIITPSNNQVL